MRPKVPATQILDDDGNEILDEDGNPVPHVETFTVEKDTILHIWEAKYKKVSSSTGNPLVIHSGTQANQHNFYYISDMQTKSLTTGKIFDADEDYDKNEETLIRERDRERYQSLSGNPDKQEEFLETLREAENMSIDDISVTTVHDANVAMCVIDGALEYALDTATTLGAYLQRLEMTENNLVTTEENTVASESVIGDADMAKEFTEYTKANILKQASQAMIAQANQNSAGILNLLR